MSYGGCVGYARFSTGAHKPHALRPNQMQVLTNVPLSSYGVSTFTLWGQTFTLWVHPHQAALRPNQMQVFKNVQLSFYGVRTFTLCCQTFTLWVHPHTGRVLR